MFVLGGSDVGARTKELGVVRDISKQLVEKGTNQMGIRDCFEER